MTAELEYRQRLPGDQEDIQNPNNVISYTTQSGEVHQAESVRDAMARCPYLSKIPMEQAEVLLQSYLGGVERMAEPYPENGLKSNQKEANDNGNNHPISSAFSFDSIFKLSGKDEAKERVINQVSTAPNQVPVSSTKQEEYQTGTVLPLNDQLLMAELLKDIPDKLDLETTTSKSEKHDEKKKDTPNPTATSPTKRPRFEPKASTMVKQPYTKPFKKVTVDKQAKPVKVKTVKKHQTQGSDGIQKTIDTAPISHLPKQKPIVELANIEEPSADSKSVIEQITPVAAIDQSEIIINHLTRSSADLYQAESTNSVKEVTIELPAIDEPAVVPEIIDLQSLKEEDDDFNSSLQTINELNSSQADYVKANNQSDEYIASKITKPEAVIKLDQPVIERVVTILKTIENEIEKEFETIEAELVREASVENIATRVEPLFQELFRALQLDITAKEVKVIVNQLTPELFEEFKTKVLSLDLEHLGTREVKKILKQVTAPTADYAQTFVHIGKMILNMFRRYNPTA